MHIADGILSLEVCLAADATAVVGVYLLGRRIRSEEVPRMGLMAAALFTASLLHLPVAGTSIHLGLMGLAGILLGRRSFPVICATLLFQSLLFQHGGLVAVGVNTINMGAGALLAWFIWQVRPLPLPVRAFLCGLTGILLPALLMALEFHFSGYGRSIFYLLYVYLLTGTMEGVLTTVAVSFFKRANPVMLGLPPAALTSAHQGKEDQASSHG
ncbi:MAG: cobalt transporter CbiM [Acidobacteria bacterium]|nr:cobalt transporter CbiM [Acidobacteriota bacterium]